MDVWSAVKGREIPRRRSLNSNGEIKSQRVKFDVLRDIMPIYHLSRICGLLPVRIIRSESGRYSAEMDYTQEGYGILLILALTGSQCYGLYRDLRDGWQNSTRLSSESSITVTVSDVFAVMSVAIVVILGSPYRWRHLQKAFDKLTEVEDKLGVATSKNLRKMSITVIACSFSYLIVIAASDFFSWGVSASTESREIDGDKGPVNYCPMYLMYVVMVVFELQYATVLFCVGERFRKLNRVIEELTKNQNFRRDDGRKKPIMIKRGRITNSILYELNEQHVQRNRLDNRAEGNDSAMLAEAIDQLITLHGILCDSINCINKAYGIGILMGTISCLIHLIITPYFFYNHIYSRSPNSWPLLIIQSFWILAHVARVMLFVQPCHMVVVKAKKTGALVNEALAMSWNPEVEKQLKIFTIQLLQRPIEFTACGLFYLNRGLMTSIAGSVTTYLVILVQFQTADDTKGTKNLLENASELLKNVSTFKNIFAIKQ